MARRRFDIRDSTRVEDDFSLIERLADEIRTEEDIKVTAEDRSAVVQDLYEGPKKCQCCINWMSECPHDVDLAALEKEDEDEEEGSPLVVRRRVTPGPAGSVLSLHSIEIRHAATRKVLIDVFAPYDGIVHNIKYLAFLAPFHQFFWRWEHFEQAVNSEEDKTVKRILGALRWIVRRELAEAFAVSKELAGNGVITFKYLWTLFPPGELVYSDEEREDQCFVLRSIEPGDVDYTLTLSYVDWDGNRFGTATQNMHLRWFPGTRAINCLKAFPAKYHQRYEELKQNLTERGRKFVGLAGMHYKAYRDPTAADPSAEQRVMIDALQSRCKGFLNRIWAEDYDFPQATNTITQAPVDSPPARGHVPLGRRKHDPDDDGSEYEWQGRRTRRLDTPEFRPRTPPSPEFRPRSPRYSPGGAYSPTSPTMPTRTRVPPSKSHSSSDHEAQEALQREFQAAIEREKAKRQLSDLQLLVCVPRVIGYDLKAKRWSKYTRKATGETRVIDNLASEGLSSRKLTG